MRLPPILLIALLCIWGTTADEDGICAQNGYTLDDHKCGDEMAEVDRNHDERVRTYLSAEDAEYSVSMTVSIYNDWCIDEPSKWCVPLINFLAVRPLTALSYMKVDTENDEKSAGAKLIAFCEENSAKDGCKELIDKMAPCQKKTADAESVKACETSVNELCEMMDDDDKETALCMAVNKRISQEILSVAFKHTTICSVKKPIHLQTYCAKVIKTSLKTTAETKDFFKKECGLGGSKMKDNGQCKALLYYCAESPGEFDDYCSLINKAEQLNKEIADLLKNKNDLDKINKAMAVYCNQWQEKTGKFEDRESCMVFRDVVTEQEQELAFKLLTKSCETGMEEANCNALTVFGVKSYEKQCPTVLNHGCQKVVLFCGSPKSSELAQSEQMECNKALISSVDDKKPEIENRMAKAYLHICDSGKWEEQCAEIGAKFLLKSETEMVKNLGVICEKDGKACKSVAKLILNKSGTYTKIAGSVCITEEQTKEGPKKGQIQPVCQRLIEACKGGTQPTDCPILLEDETYLKWLKRSFKESDVSATISSLQVFCKPAKDNRNCQRSIEYLLAKDDDKVFSYTLYTACNDDSVEVCDVSLEKTFNKKKLKESFTSVCPTTSERQHKGCKKLHDFCGEHATDTECLPMLYTYRVDSIGTLLNPFNVEEITKLYGDTCTGENEEICETLKKELKSAKVAVADWSAVVEKLCLTGSSTAAATIPACDNLLTELLTNYDPYAIFTNLCKVTELTGKKEETYKCKLFVDKCKIPTNEQYCENINNDGIYSELVAKMKETNIPESSKTLFDTCNAKSDAPNCGRLKEVVMKKESYATAVTNYVCNGIQNSENVCKILVEDIFKQPFFEESYNSVCTDDPARVNRHCKTITTVCKAADSKKGKCTFIERREELDGIDAVLTKKDKENDIAGMYKTMCDGETEDLCTLMNERVLKEDVKVKYLNKVIYHVCDTTSQSVPCKSLLQAVLVSEQRGGSVYVDACQQALKSMREKCALFTTFCKTATSTDKILKGNCEQIEDDSEYGKYMAEGFDKGKTATDAAAALNTACTPSKRNDRRQRDICNRLMIHVQWMENTHIEITEEGCRKSDYQDLCPFLVEAGFNDYDTFPDFIKRVALKNCANETAPPLLCPTMIKQCDSTKDKQKCVELHEMKCTGKTKEDEFCKQKFDFYCTLDSQTTGDEAKKERDTCIRFVGVFETKTKIYLDMLFERCETEATKDWCDRITTAILPLANEAMRDCDNDNGKHLKACERVLTVCKSKSECSLRVPIQECEKKGTTKEDALKCEAHITSQCSQGEFPGKSVSCENFVEKYASKENRKLLLEHSTICSAEIEEPMYSHCRKIGSAFDMLNSGKQLFNGQCAKGENFGETNNCLVLQHTCNIIEAENSICKTVRTAGSILKDYSAIVEGKENAGIDISQAVTLLSKYCPEEDTQFSEVFCDLPEAYFKKNSISVSIYGNACDSEQTRVCDRYFDKTIKTLSDGEIFENVYTPVCDDSEKRKTIKCEKLHEFCQPKDSDQCVTISRQYEVDAMEETHFKNLNSQNLVEFYGKICDDGKTDSLCQDLEKRILEDTVDSSKFVDLVRDMCSQDQVMKERCERFLSVILKSPRSDEIFLVNCDVDKEDGQSAACKEFFNSCPVETAEPYEGCAKVKVDRRYTELKVLLKETNIPESASTVFTACSKEDTVDSKNCQRLTATVSASETFIIPLSETLCNNETVETFSETVCNEMLKLALKNHKEAIDKLSTTNCETMVTSSLCKSIKTLCEPATGRRCFKFHNFFCGKAGDGLATHKECFDYFKVYCTDMEKIADSEEETENEHCLTFMKTTFATRKDPFLDRCEPDIEACANGAELELKSGSGKIMSSMFTRKCDKKADSEKILCTTVQNLCSEETEQNREPCGVVAEPTCQNRPFQECLPYLGRHCSGELTSACTKLLSKGVTDANNAIGAFVHYCASGKSKAHCTTALEKSLEKGTLVEAFDLLCTTPEQVSRNASCGAISTLCSNKQDENCKKIINKKKKIEIESGSTCAAADADCDNKLNEFCVSSFQEETCEKLFEKMSKEILLEYYKKFCRNDENAAMCQRTKEKAEKSHFVGYFFGEICKGSDILFGKECKKTLRGLCSDKTVEGCDTVHSPYTLILIIGGVGAGLGSLLMISAVALFVYKSKKLASKQLQVAQKKKDVQLDSMMGSAL